MTTATQATAPQALTSGQGIAAVEQAASQITATHVARSELQFRQAFLALRIRDYEQVDLKIARLRRQILDQARALEAKLAEIYWPKKVPEVRDALRLHTREHGAEATVRLLQKDPEAFGPVRGMPMSRSRKRARESVPEAALRLDGIHRSRRKLGDLRHLATSKSELVDLRRQLGAVSSSLRELPSIPALHHQLVHAVERAGGLPAVVSHLSPPTLAIAERALLAARSFARGLSR
jgi:hypothetical protein